MSGWSKSYRNGGYKKGRKRSKPICIHTTSKCGPKAYVHVYYDYYHKFMIVAKKDTHDGQNIMFDKDILNMCVYVSTADQIAINDKFKKMADIYPITIETTTTINKLIIIHMHQIGILDHYRDLADQVYESIDDIKYHISMQIPHEYGPYKTLKQTGFIYAIIDTLAYKSQMSELFDHQLCFDDNNYE